MEKYNIALSVIQELIREKEEWRTRDGLQWSVEYGLEQGVERLQYVKELIEEKMSELEV